MIIAFSIVLNVEYSAVKYSTGDNVIALLCFSKLHHKTTYNRLYKTLTFNDILYEKQIGFKEEHSTEHSIIQLNDQINNTFEKKSFLR